MFSFLDASGSMGPRLPQKARERFMEKHGTGLFMTHGAVVKEYVIVPDHLLQKTISLKPYFTASLAYVGALKAKPTSGSAKKRCQDHCTLYRTSSKRLPRSPKAK